MGDPGQAGGNHVTEGREGGHNKEWKQKAHFGGPGWITSSNSM